MGESFLKELNLDKFENQRTQLATARRAEKDGNVRNAIGHIQDALEQLPLTDETAIQFKGQADIARNLFKNSFVDSNQPFIWLSLCYHMLVSKSLTEVH